MHSIGTLWSPRHQHKLSTILYSNCITLVKFSHLVQTQQELLKKMSQNENVTFQISTILQTIDETFFTLQRIVHSKFSHYLFSLMSFQSCLSSVEHNISRSYKRMPFWCCRIQKSPFTETANIETDLHFLFQTIWLVLRKSKQPTLHVYLPTDSIKSAWHKHPHILTWVTRTNIRMKWIWMLPHQRQLVKKALQMVRDEWTKAHFIGSQKNKMAECVLAAVQSCVESPVWLCYMHNMTNASCCVWEHHSGFGQLLVQFMIFLWQWRPVFWITRMECSWTSNNLFEWSIKPNPTRKAQS